ncbi:MAG: hypothetical protein JO211_04090 [Acidobacteriaceae bacterium]|nr:hypothetical protein [Acidobacteriaceae bacterium]
MRKAGCAVLLMIAIGCAPPKPTVPSLTPEGAGELLHYNNRAAAWLITVKKQDPTCEYRLDLPDQLSHPAELDLEHIMYCGGRPSPKEYDASVVFTYDKDAQKWVITRFSS